MDILRIIGFILYIATGVGFLIASAATSNIAWALAVIVISAFYFQGFKHHSTACLHLNHTSRNRVLVIFVASALAAVVTWYFNHELGFGPMVANGLVGVIVGLTLPLDIAGAAYTSSFVGMSAALVLPTLGSSVVAGCLAGLIIAGTTPVCNGIGGKGGTTAAAAVLITMALLHLIGS